MAHQVKIKLPCVDTNGHDVTIVLDGEIRANCLETTNGNVYIRRMDTPVVDCMPGIHKPVETDFVKAFRAKLEARMHVAEDNYQKECKIPISEWRQANFSGYLAAVTDIFREFTDCAESTGEDERPIERLDIQSIQISEFGAYLEQLVHTSAGLQASLYSKGYIDALNTITARFNKIFKEA